MAEARSFGTPILERTSHAVFSISSVTGWPFPSTAIPFSRAKTICTQVCAISARESRAASAFCRARSLASAPCLASRLSSFWCCRTMSRAVTCSWVSLIWGHLQGSGRGGCGRRQAPHGARAYALKRVRTRWRAP
jgi:hypothetical protein